MAAWLLIEAHDVWFFRTSRPFGSDQATALGEAQVLPPPGVVLGGLRTALGCRWGVDWKAYAQAWAAGPAEGGIARLGPPEGDPHAGIRLGGTLPVRIHAEHDDCRPLVLAPEFLQVAHEAAGADRIRRQDLRLARPRRDAGGIGRFAPLDPVLPQAPSQDGGPFEPVGRLIELDALAQILTGTLPATLRTESIEDLAPREPRTGLARDVRRRVGRQGLLFGHEPNRWAARTPLGGSFTYGLQALVHGLDEPGDPPTPGEPLWLSLGGEQRFGYARRIDAQRDGWLDAAQRAAVRAAILDRGGWYVTLAAPAAFERGWLPDDVFPRDGIGWEARDDTGQLLGRLVGYLAAAPAPVSGWDLRQGRPKPLRFQLPAGSTWFFRLPEHLPAADLEALVAWLDARFQGTCPHGIDRHAGHGLGFLGAWDARDDATSTNP